MRKKQQLLNLLHTNDTVAFFFTAILDLLTEETCKQNPCQMCDVFVSDWVQFLIHIHDKL